VTISDDRPIGIKRMENRMESTGPHHFAMEGWISCAPFERLLHIKIVEACGGKATLTMPFLIDFAQGAGLLHGGALVSLADTAVVMAIKSTLPPQTHFATISLETRFLRPVRQGLVTAKARVTDQTENILKGKATLFDEDERPVLEFSSTFKIARDRAIRGIELREPGKIQE
jgi:acyl-CoA thioesterase